MDLTEIEDTITTVAQAYLQKIAITATQAPGSSEKRMLVAWCIPVPDIAGAAALPRVLRDLSRTVLPIAMVPARFVATTEFPFTSTGKVVGRRNITSQKSHPLPNPTWIIAGGAQGISFVAITGRWRCRRNNCC
jgi:hypothetical protein